MSSNSRWHRLAVPLVLVLLVGCQAGPSGSLTARQPDFDPLKGNGPPMPPSTGSAVAHDTRGPGATLTSTGSGNSARTPGTLPLIANPSGSSSQAALVAGPGSSLDQAAPLRIGGNPATDARDTGWQRPGEAPRATLQPPAPAGPAGTDTVPAVPLPLNQVAHASGATLEQLLQQLRDRGGIQPEAHVNQQTGEWTCTCRIPNRTNPNLLHCYEATADTSVAAAQSLLVQIDQDRR
jgi:hypothetical protein